MPQPEQVAISVFKAKCLSIIERVGKTGKPVVVTRFGVPMARVVPPEPPERKKSWLGCLAGTGRIKGDIVSPAAAEQDWEVLKP
jgi:prevent-host-death family protein